MLRHTYTKDYVQIVLISFYDVETTELVIRRLHEVTDYKFNLTVGDNRSPRSPEMKAMLSRLLEEGLIDCFVMFGENYYSSSVNFILENVISEKTKYTITTDYDAYLPDKLSPCWLTKFVEYLDNHPKVGMVGFHSTIGALSENGVPHQNSGQEWCEESRSGTTECLFNGHFMTLRTDLLYGYMMQGNAIHDGGFRIFVGNSGFLRARYDKASVKNLSTIKMDNWYKRLRSSLLRGGRDEKGRSMVDLCEIKKFEIHERIRT